MEIPWAWLNNPWVTGIGGGVVSGLIVFIITKWLFSEQSKRDLAQKVAAANREIVYSVRSGIPEGTIPSGAVLISLIKATARKFEVDSHRLHGVSEIGEDLIKEVMDSSFIPSKTKEEYCDKLAAMIADEKAGTPRRGSETPLQGAYTNTSIAVTTMAAAVGALTAAMSIVFSLLSRQEAMGIEIDSSVPRDFIRTIIIPVLVAVAALMSSLLVAVAMRQRIRRRERSVEDTMRTKNENVSEKMDAHNVSRLEPSFVDAARFARNF